MKTAYLIKLLIRMVVFGNLVIATMPIYAESMGVYINIRPGSDPNSIKGSANGVITVLIHGSKVLDVTHIDPESLKLQLSPLQ
ncbi:MAG: hypothetical protein IBX56_11535, partial [Methylomicrobium sp.]|nr:hypothetical protein [Methylomicrobium sp.]